MPAKRDTRIEASRLRILSPHQTVENQSLAWGYAVTPALEGRGLHPHGELSYEANLHLAVCPEMTPPFDQRIARDAL